MSDLAAGPDARRSVSALIVTWNNQATIADCIAALRRELPTDGEVLTFDNHSLDESARIAEASGARVQVHESNIGFAAGMNRLAAQADGDVLLLVNPDVFMCSSAVGSVLSHFRGGNVRKIVGGLLFRTNGDPEMASARPFPTASSLALWLLTRKRPTWPLPTSARTVQAVSGAFFAITRELWRELGGFDEGYLHSGEDLDLFWRAARSGASVWFEPAAKATHLGSASVHQASLQIDALRLAGAIRLVRKREGPLAAALLRAVLLVRSVSALLLDSLRIHRLSDQRRARARALVSLAVLGQRDPRLRLPIGPERHM